MSHHSLHKAAVSDFTDACKGIQKYQIDDKLTVPEGYLLRGKTLNLQVIHLIRTAVAYELHAASLKTHEDRREESFYYATLAGTFRYIADHMVRSNNSGFRLCGRLYIKENGNVYRSEVLRSEWNYPETSVLSTWAHELAEIMQADTNVSAKTRIDVECNRFSFVPSDARVKKLHELIKCVQKNAKTATGGCAHDAILLYLLKVLIIGTENLPEGFLEVSIMYDGRLVEGRTK